MKKMKLILASLAIALISASSASAVLVSAGSSQRIASLGSAESAITGSGNANKNVLNALSYLGFSDWDEYGEETSSGNSGVFNVDLTSGSWGNGDAAGTWEITDSSFWSNYTDVAISMHVGNGGGDPDHWIWEITQGELSGTWSYDKISGGGGGLSNLKLYGRGTPTTTPPANTPDAGSTLALMGIALAGLGALKRRK